MGAGSKICSTPQGVLFRNIPGFVQPRVFDSSTGGFTDVRAGVLILGCVKTGACSNSRGVQRLRRDFGAPYQRSYRTYFGKLPGSIEVGMLK